VQQGAYQKQAVLLPEADQIIYKPGGGYFGSRATKALFTGNRQEPRGRARGGAEHCAAAGRVCGTNPPSTSPSRSARITNPAWKRGGKSRPPGATATTGIAQWHTAAAYTENRHRQRARVGWANPGTAYMPVLLD
jgi:hypothetical protein